MRSSQTSTVQAPLRRASPGNVAKAVSAAAAVHKRKAGRRLTKLRDRARRNRKLPPRIDTGELEDSAGSDSPGVRHRRYSVPGPSAEPVLGGEGGHQRHHSFPLAGGERPQSPGKSLALPQTRAPRRSLSGEGFGVLLSSAASPRNAPAEVPVFLEGNEGLLRSALAVAWGLLVGLAVLLPLVGAIGFAGALLHADGRAFALMHGAT